MTNQFDPLDMTHQDGSKRSMILHTIERKRHPSRPRRGIGVELESTDSEEINDELKAWIRGGLSAQLQTFREEIYGWLHPNERCSNPDNRRRRSLDRKCKACEKKTAIEQS
ncbi:hypothetical protein YC2023_045457 [Brassica napus]